MTRMIGAAKEVIETVFLDWGLAFGSGALFALAARDRIAASPSRLRTRAFAWGFAYLHLGVMTISLALYVMNRDWMWMYWVDPRRLPVGIEVLAFVLYDVCFIAGFLLTADLPRRARWLPAGAAAAAIVFLEISARTRLFRFGTFEQFRSGNARPAVAFDPLRIQPEWWLVSVAGVASLAVLVLLLRRIVRDRA